MNKAPSGDGVGFASLLFLLLLGLKLGHVIDWSWWWIAAPLWIPAALVLGIWAVALIVIVLVAAGRRGA